MSVSEYLELASLQNTQTGGPRGFSDVIGVLKEGTEKFAEFFFYKCHDTPILDTAYFAMLK